MKTFAIAAATTLIAAPAMAHTGHGETSGLVAGLMHPVAGPDHLLAMLAVGLWSGFALPRRVWAGAAAFLSAMGAGALLSWSGVGIPGVETWITLSVLVFGVMTVLARPGQGGAVTGGALAAIAGFALFHGHAHATEAVGNAPVYLGGFLAASGALHLAGIAIARWAGSGRLALALQRGLGGAVAAGGLALIAG